MNHPMATAAVDAEGRVLALAVKVTEDFGAYCFYPANYLTIIASNAPAFITHSW